MYSLSRRAIPRLQVKRQTGTCRQLAGNGTGFRVLVRVKQGASICSRPRWRLVGGGVGGVTEGLVLAREAVGICRIMMQRRPARQAGGEQVEGAAQTLLGRWVVGASSCAKLVLCVSGVAIGRRFAHQRGFWEFFAVSAGLSRPVPVIPYTKWGCY